MGVQHRGHRWGHRWGRTVAKVKGHSGREGREGRAPVRARNADLGDVEDRVRCAYPMMRSIRWARGLETSERGLGFLTEKFVVFLLARECRVRLPVGRYRGRGNYVVTVPHG